MENQNHQSIIIVGKDTQPPAASSQPPAKGSLAREIGMAIFGQFLTLIVTLFLIFFITTFTTAVPQKCGLKVGSGPPICYKAIRDNRLLQGVPNHGVH